jgi:putative iron-regulated protein
MKNSRIFAVVAASMVVGLAACSGGGNGGKGTNSELVTNAAVQENYVKLAHAAYSDSLTTAQSLSAGIDTFLANPTDDNLATARLAYRGARVPYQQSEIMRFDTAITLEFGLSDDGGPASVDDWEGQVNAWPLDENFIVDIIQGDDVINVELLVGQNGADSNEANVTTGVHAVEFMLWGTDTNGVGAGAGERPASDFANDGSCADAFCERRAQYLRAATDLLLADLVAMVAEWSPGAETTQGTLAYNFLNSTEALDYIVGSLRSMASDELAGARMNAGLELGDPEEEHDCFSDLSHVAIYYNFQGVRNAYYGRYGDLSGPSIADLVKQKNQATHDAVDASLNSIEQHMADILAAGDREVDPIRYDQIIGQDASAPERMIAEAAVIELIEIDADFDAVKELLSLTEIGTGGSGDSD